MPATRAFKPVPWIRRSVDPTQLSLRTYEPPDETAVWALHEWAIAETGVDPSDIPGTDDLRTVETSYLDPGGDFVVGVVDADSPPVDPATTTTTVSGEDVDLTTTDGTLAAMGGYMPNLAGHGDERDRPGAAELHRMRVAPPYQRQGFGRALLSELERR
ncbi:hypothetical protein DJ72_09110, partial [Halorubrum distributum]